MRRPLAACWRFIAAFALATGLAATGPAARAQSAPLPLAAFFDNVSIRDVKLSPSGRYLAMATAAKDGRILLAVVDADRAEKPQVVAWAPFADIRSFEWVDDDWLVYNVVDLQAAAYDQSFGPGLISVRRDGSQTRLLMRTRWDDDSSTGTHIVQTRLDPNHRLLTVLRDGSHDVIVGEYTFNGAGEFQNLTPKRLDVATGRTTRLGVGAPAHASEWIFDAAGVPRVVVTDFDGSVETFWRDAADQPWRSLEKSGQFENAWTPRAVDAANRLYVGAGSAASTTVLKRFDFATGKPEPEPIASAPGFDLAGGLLFDDGRRKLVGVRIVTDAETTVWFDPALTKLQAMVDARFPNRVNRVNRIDCERCGEDGAVLVHSYGDHDPGSWSVYHPKTESWTSLGSARPAVDPRRMADLDFHRIKARDGLDLPVWVTRPKAAKGATPAVLLVHGGPWVRGVSWGWDAEAQFLASRGYTVVQPEFRGSLGYGTRHFRAGWKNWGTTMQDDLADAVRWAADKGLVDPARVCIAGASYGGYAALMAPIRYPELFKCSVAWVAVADPRLLFSAIWNSDISEQDRRYSLRTLIGDPVRDADLLKAASPIERAAELKVPLLLAYGRDDRRVPLEHADRMIAALKAAGRPPEVVLYDNEGHGFNLPANRLDFYGRVETFLQRNLGAPSGTGP